MKKAHVAAFITIILILLSSAAAIVLLNNKPATSTTPTQYTYTVINEYPHDQNAFTEGLVYNNGYLYESTGSYPNPPSTLRRRRPHHRQHPANHHPSRPVLRRRHHPVQQYYRTTNLAIKHWFRLRHQQLQPSAKLHLLGRRLGTNDRCQRAHHEQRNCIPNIHKPKKLRKNRNSRSPR